MIQNKDRIDESANDALDILEAGLHAAQPEIFLPTFVKKNKLILGKKSYALSKYDKVFLVAVGKAADSMAQFVHNKIKSDGGIIVVPRNYRVLFSHKKFQILRAGHPLPTNASVKAAMSIIAFLESRKKDDLVVFLVSGGASALVSLPLGVTLAQKQHLVRVLLGSGAAIDEINALRKHLSQVKGGRILKHLKCNAVSFVMSDVVGDDLSSIGSGLTYCDRTTFSKCNKIIQKYRLQKRLSPQILAVIKNGMRGLVDETPKKPVIPHQIVATNKRCLDAMETTARRLGYKTNRIYPLTGDVAAAAGRLVREFSFAKRSCLVFGGETTVHVRGNGRGGRNQELVLHVLNAASKNALVASVGTDGIDGNTRCAGAMSRTGIPASEIRRYLENNDSNSFFKKHGGLIMTGPTHTNLMDLGVILTAN
ncbi:glycerate kinase type-2 family protein [Candidatus Nitrosotenuis cloacae]|uniref:glycerate kinase type-2 family protein n=1 Tax=Candidatus Nitrosotenuis cloacae TaxID=1603555 RepID=UPI00228049BE|nr:DUF4147 domain-containing protein [Candidatus Nitrosotenuis cloacae]